MEFYSGIFLIGLFTWLASGYPTDEVVIHGEYLMVLQDGLGAEDFVQIKVIRTFSINDVVILQAYISDDILEELATDPRIKTLEPNQATITAMECHEQATLEELWGLSRLSSREKPEYPTATYQYEDVSDGHGVDVYVVDTGIYLEHNDFEGRAVHGFTAPGITEGDDDLNGHGTHVTGIVGGAEHGVAKNANLVAVKVLNSFGSGMTSDLAAGMEFVVQQHAAKNNSKSVMNLSLGASGSPAIDEAVEATIRAGVSAAVVAGNSNSDACLFSPGRVQSAVTAASMDSTDSMLASSNYGTCVNILAPGSLIKSTFIGSPDATAVMSGSSLAGPHAAGWMARYMSAFDDSLTPAEVKMALEDLSTKDAIHIPPGKEETPNRILYAACSWIPE